MSGMFCTTCGRFKTIGHRCPPSWRWREKGDEEWHGERLFATDAEDAAIAAAAVYDRDDGSIGRGNDGATLQVQREGETKIHTFDVTGYMVPEYQAEEVEDDGED